MADIRPFRGLHYNQPLLKDWPAVICPVYDIIPPEQQPELYRRSEYNFVRLELGRELPQDTATDNKYTRSAATLEQWLRQGVLEVEATPAIYLYDQYFTHQGKGYQRRGLIARVRVEEWDRMVIRPHEGTMTEPKGDRLNLLSALQANASPILALYTDPEQQIASLLATQERKRPLMNLENAAGDGHTVWAITEPEVISQISRSLAEQPLYIADGHHRYESALAYRHQRYAASPSASGDEAFNFTMMTLVDAADPGLLILPPHRLVRGLARPTLQELRAKLAVFFEIEELSLDQTDAWQQADRWLTEKNEIRLILFGLDTEHLFRLRLTDPASVSQMMPYFHTELYRQLDVSVVDHVILEKLLALSRDKEVASLAYSYDYLDAVNRVLSQEYQLAFLLSPIKVAEIKAIADAGDKMPRKSTYFYPKLPAGLMLNQLI